MVSKGLPTPSIRRCKLGKAQVGYDHEINRLSFAIISLAPAGQFLCIFLCLLSRGRNPEHGRWATPSPAHLPNPALSQYFLHYFARRTCFLSSSDFPPEGVFCAPPRCLAASEPFSSTADISHRPFPRHFCVQVLFGPARAVRHSRSSLRPEAWDSSGGSCTVHSGRSVSHSPLARHNWDK